MIIKKIEEKKSREYVTPKVTEITYRIELGYAGSTRPGHGWGDINHPHTGPGRKEM